MNSIVLCYIFWTDLIPLKLFRQTSNDKSSQCWIWKTWSGFLCIITFGWLRAGGATSAATKLLLVVQKRQDIGTLHVPEIGYWCTTCTTEAVYARPVCVTVSHGNTK